MDFNLNDEQRMLAESVGRFVQSRYDLKRRRDYLASPGSFSADNWNMLAELGITALALPSELGGFDAGRSDIAVVMEQLGRGLVVEPVLLSAVIAARLVAASPAHAEMASAIATGARRIAIALADPPAGRDIPAAPLRWEAAGEGFRLNGTKTLAVQSSGADTVIFPCWGTEGFAAYLIDPNGTPGITRRDYYIIDGSLASEFQLNNVPVAGDARLDITSDDWIAAGAWGDIAACAEMLGITDRLLEETADHMRTRKQFGVAIGTFQALQHKMARMLMQQEKARALLYRAVAMPEEQDWLGAAQDCRNFMSRAALEIGEGCLHLHGGMGVTDELFVGHALKRLHFLRVCILVAARSGT